MDPLHPLTTDTHKRLFFDWNDECLLAACLPICGPSLTVSSKDPPFCAAKERVQLTVASPFRLQASLWGLPLTLPHTL